MVVEVIFSVVVDSCATARAAKRATGAAKRILKDCGVVLFDWLLVGNDCLPLVYGRAV